MMLASRPFGDSGLEVSVVGLGCNNFGRRIDLAATRAVVDAALDEGVTFFDTANIYGRGQQRGVPRRGPGGTPRPGHAGDQVRDGHGGRQGAARLTRLHPAGDRGVAAPPANRHHRLLLVPPPGRGDPDRRDAGSARRAGPPRTVRAIGASNFSAQQLEEADAVARERGLTRFTAVQNEYSLLVRDAEHDVLPGMRAAGNRLRSVLPARLGSVDRQVPSRRGRTARSTPVGPRRDRAPTSSST